MMNVRATPRRAENNAKLLRLLQDVPPEKRTARFRCVLAVASRALARTAVPTLGALSTSSTGIPRGAILSEHRGSGGFGYDPALRPRRISTNLR